MLCIPIWILLICWLKCFLIFAVDSAVSVCIVLGLHDGYFWLSLLIPEFIAVVSWDVEIMHSSSWSWMSLNLRGHHNYYSRAAALIHFGSSYTFSFLMFFWCLSIHLSFLFGTVLQCLMIRRPNPIGLLLCNILNCLLCYFALFAAKLGSSLQLIVAIAAVVV
jgi:hypothetical protein